MELGNNLKKIRKEKKLSQADIATNLGVSRSTVGKWETEDNYPTVEMLDKLANLLAVSTDDLLGRDPTLESYKRTKENVKVLVAFSRLNDIGKKEAIKRIDELAEIPRYTRDMPIAAHNDAVIDEKELELMRQDVDEL